VFVAVTSLGWASSSVLDREFLLVAVKAVVQACSEACEMRVFYIPDEVVRGAKWVAVQGP